MTKTIDEMFQEARPPNRAWLEHVKKISDGTVILLEGDPSSEISIDVRYALNVVIMQEVLSFFRPDKLARPLVDYGDIENISNIYAWFSAHYYYLIGGVEDKIGDKLWQDAISAGTSTPFLAARLTSDFFPGHVHKGGRVTEYQAPSSKELFAILGSLILSMCELFDFKIEDYEKLDDLENLYAFLTSDIFINFLLHLISIDDSISPLGHAFKVVAQANSTLDESGLITKIDTHKVFEVRHGKPEIKKDILYELKRLALSNPQPEHTVEYRKISRGCPFLYTKNKKRFLLFAVEEFIKHHRHYFMIKCKL